MGKYAVSAVFVCLFAFLAPSVSNAAFVNYSGTLKGASAKFMYYTQGKPKYDMETFKAVADRSSPNIGVLFDLTKGFMTRVGDTPQPAVAIFSNCAVSLLSRNLLPAGDGKYIGNCDVQIRFFKGTVSYNPVADAYSGTGQVYIMYGGSQVFALADPARKKGLIKVSNITPYYGAVLNVTDGAVGETFMPAIAKAISLPAFTLVEIPAP